MANLLGNNIGTNYRGILNIGSTINTPLGSTLSTITDGMGNNSTLQLSTSLTKIDSNLITGGATAASARLQVRGDGTNAIFRAESTTTSTFLEMLNNGNTTLSSGSLTISNGHVTAAGRYTSTGGYSNTSGIAISALESSSTFGAAVGNAIFRPISISYTINNTGTQSGIATGIFLNAIESNLLSMSHFLMDLQRGNVSQFSVQRNGVVTAASHINTSGDLVATSTTAQVRINDTKLARGGDGVFIMYNNAENGFNRLNFGGTSSVFPALKRNGANIEFRLADDTGYANVIMGQLTLNSTLTSSRLEMNGDYLGINSVAAITGGGSNGIINIGPWSGADMRINMSTSTNMTSLINGTGSPEGVVTARVGSIYMRKDGGAGTSFYVKESGTGNTGWVAK